MVGELVKPKKVGTLFTSEFTVSRFYGLVVVKAEWRRGLSHTCRHTLSFVHKPAAGSPCEQPQDALVPILFLTRTIRCEMLKSVLLMRRITHPNVGKVAQ